MANWKYIIQSQSLSCTYAIQFANKTFKWRIHGRNERILGQIWLTGNDGIITMNLNVWNEYREDKFTSLKYCNPFIRW